MMFSVFKKVLLGNDNWRIRRKLALWYGSDILTLGQAVKVIDCGVTEVLYLKCFSKHS